MATEKEVKYCLYKITNDINDKVYIGKKKGSIENRLKRHISDAKKGLDCHISRAILLYGEEHFSIELLEEVNTYEEMGQRERYWIAFYNSRIEGYNETDGGDGGNTYINKTSEEMEEIKQKIRETKMGDNNPHHRKVKGKNIKTGEVIHFNTLKEGKNYFNETNHGFISRRCKEIIKFPYKGEWLFAYEENEFINDYTFSKVPQKCRRIKVLDLERNIEKVFNSFTEAEKYFNEPRRLRPQHKMIKGEVKIFLKRYQITALD